MPSALARIQLRQGLSSEWVTSNPVLTVGEPGVENDTLKLKIGDGTRTWNQLPYVGEAGVAGTSVTSVNSKTGAVVLLPSDLPGLAGFIKTVVSQTLAPGAHVQISDLTVDGRINISADGSTVTGIGVSSVNGQSGSVALVGAGGITVATGTTAGEIGIGVQAGTWAGDPAAPAAPTNVTAVGLDAQAQVSWTPSAGTPAAEYYTVQFSDDSAATWQPFGVTTGPVAAMTVTGLSNDTPYVFRVRASAGASASAWSAPSSPTIPTGASQPPTQINLSAQSIVENNAVDAVVGTLSAVSPNVKASHSYAVSGGTNASDFAIMGTSLLAHSVLKVSGGATRSVAITATNSAGLSLSKTFSIAVVASSSVPSAPSNLTASADAITASGAGISLAWNAPADNGAAISSYHIQCKATADASWAEGPSVGTLAAASISGLTAGTAYSVRVSAINSKGEGAFATASVTTAKAVISFAQQPQNASTTDGTAQFTAAATTSGTSPLSYQWQKASSATAWADVSGATLSTFSITKATNSDNGAKYRAKVSAADADPAYSDTAVLSAAIPLWRRTDSPISFSLTGEKGLPVYNQAAAASDGTTAVAVWVSSGKLLSATTTDGATFTTSATPTSGPNDLLGDAAECFLSGAASKGFNALMHTKEFNARFNSYGTGHAYRKWTPDGQAWIATGSYVDTTSSIDYVATPGLTANVTACTSGFYGWSVAGAPGVGSYVQARSTDGIAWSYSAAIPWTPVGGPTADLYGLRVVAAGSALYAYTALKGATSANAGQTWTTASPPPLMAGDGVNTRLSGWSFSAYAGGKLFLFRPGNQYAVTSNFTTWTIKTLPFTDAFRLAAASPDGKRIAVIGSRQQAAVCVDVASETWSTEQMPVAGSGLTAIAATTTNIIAFGNGECCVRDVVSEADPQPNTSYNCVSGTCTAVTGLGGTYPTLAACRAACAASPPPANPTAAFKATVSQWRHETVDRPPCAAARLTAPQLSFNACRVSWPADSISYSRYTVEWALTDSFVAPPAIPKQGADVGFSSTCSYLGSKYVPYSYRAVSSNSIDFYNFDKLLPAGSSARKFHMLPDTAVGATELRAAGLIFGNNNGVQVGNATDVYTSTRWSSFKITFYLSTGGTKVITVSLPAVVIDPSSTAPPTITVPSAPTGVATPTWTQASSGGVCWDIATVSWTAPSVAPDAIKLEYFVPGQPAKTVTSSSGITMTIPAVADSWVEMPSSPTTCAAGFTKGVAGLCTFTRGWSGYRRPTATSIAIYKHNALSCSTRATGQSRIFRLSFGNAGGFGTPTQFTVTT
jgi:hypothetical protein